MRWAHSAGFPARGCWGRFALRLGSETAMRNAAFEVRPIAGAIGAEVHGVDLAGDLPAETVAAVRQALLDHLVIFFRDQDLPPASFLALARRFGAPIQYSFVKGIDGFPEI